MTRAASPLGPGLGDSQRQLLDLIKRRGECAIADLEEGLALNRETLRAHLRALTSLGLVERCGARRNGPGRPHVLYRLTAGGESLFPRREGALLRELAGFLVEEERLDLLEAFFARRQARKRAALREQVAGLGRKERLERLARVLSDEGFVAEVVDREGTAGLRLCHCPLRELVAVTRLPCRFEMSLIEEVLGEPLRREEFLPEGGHACSYAAAERPGRPARRPRRRGVA